VSGLRLIAVLGYSEGGEQLHEICELRLGRAEREATTDDVVLLSGWARDRSARSEAELMAQSWTVPCRRLVLDSSAHSTLANVAGAAALARELGAGEVVLVTSRWHARRAGALLRCALGREIAITVATTDERPSLRARVRELVCRSQVPLARAGLIGAAAHADTAAETERTTTTLQRRA
jgi:uncharacterized SAM-binding protein YcdF (DUF218 family)